MILLQINSIINSGSTGRIVEDIGLTAIQAGHESFIAAATTNRPSQSKIVPIGTGWDKKLHGLKTRLFDRHGFGSVNATRNLVGKIKEIQPDVIHLHNIHGYYLNVEILFNYLKSAQIPVIWTFHDCWPFTGHCSYFDRYSCFKWQTECYQCPNKKGYPASFGLDQSKRNYYDKKFFFNGIQQLKIVTPSNWLARHVQHSFLQDYPVQIIHNGIDLNNFKPLVENTEIKRKWGLTDKKIILGVASVWDKRKGLDDFIHLSKIIKPGEQIILIGLEKNVIKGLPTGITGIERTESIAELVELYATADVFVNPTYIDNFPTTNIEAIACGTPVITYNSGGSPEAIDKQSGMVVEKGDITGLTTAINQVISKGKSHYQSMCRERAEKLFNKDERFSDYLRLYEGFLE